MGLDGCSVPARRSWNVESGHHIGRWTAERLDAGYFEARSNSIGLMHDGVIVAGVIFENWNRRSIMAHMVVEGRLNRDFIWAIFDYAYRICGVNKVICPVVETNTASAALVRHMGFAEEARLRDCSPQGDIVLFTLAKADCRFIGDWIRGKKRAPAASGS